MRELKETASQQRLLDHDSRCQPMRFRMRIAVLKYFWCYRRRQRHAGTRSSESAAGWEGHRPTE